MINITHDIESLRSLSQLFSPAVFKRIIRNDTKLFEQRIRKHVSLNESITTAELIKSLYSSFELSYKNEYIYKNTLINDLLLKKYCLETTSVLNEFKIANSIADFTLLNGEVRIYEIKTEFDGLDKLKKQISDYLKFANKVYIVTDSKFTARILNEYEESVVGVIELTSSNELNEIKPATENLFFLDHTTIFKTLRKNEYIEIINDFFGFIPEVPNTLIFRECLSLSSTIDISVFQKMAFKKLKERKLKCPNLLKSNETPYELKHICNSLNLNNKEYQSLFSFLNKTI
jgi:hypothetical protein